MEVCPENAITEIDREMGIFEAGTRNGVAFAYGRLFVGQVMAVPAIERSQGRGSAGQSEYHRCPSWHLMPGDQFGKGH